MGTDMATLRGWIGRFTETTGEELTAIVLGRADDDGWVRYQMDEWPEWDRWGKVVQVNEVPAEILDREFDDGYGGNDSPNLCAWSPSWVLFTDNYDGAEGPVWVPRNPVDHNPVRPGGG